MLSKTRTRLARLLDPATGVASSAPDVESSLGNDHSPWQPLAQQFAMRVLAASYQTSSYLAEAEDAEADPDRLARLYRIDHTITRVRRHAENLQVLTGLRIEDAGRQVTTVLDIVRAATSAIDQYTRVRVGRIAELAVVEFAADDTIRVLTELLDNATRFSSPASDVTVSAHLTDAGQILLRVEDAGMGVDPTRLPSLNAMLAGTEAPATEADAPAHLGLLVVARLAQTHRMRVVMTPRHPGGTTATVLVPGHLLCEIPISEPLKRDTAQVPRLRAVPPPQGPSARGTAQPTRGYPTQETGADLPRRRSPEGRPDSEVASLPRRMPTSLRHRDSVPAAPAAAMPGSDMSWPEDAGDFAAGIADAMHFENERFATGQFGTERFETGQFENGASTEGNVR